MRVPKFMTSLPLWQVDAAGAAIVCIAAGAWYFAGVEPLGRVRAEQETMQTELAAQRELSHAKAKQAAKQDQSLKKLREQIGSSNVHLQRVDAMNARVSALTTAAGEANLRVDEIKPSSPTMRPRFTVVPIRISGGGDYGAVMAFFGALRSRFEDTGVSGFSLDRVEASAESKGGDAEELRFVLDLVWYAAPTQAGSKK